MFFGFVYADRTPNAAKMEHAQYIVEQLETARGERGISIAELARRSDVPVKRLGYIFNGDRRLRADEFVRLSLVLGMPMTAFAPATMLSKLEEAGRRTLEDFGSGVSFANIFSDEA